MTVTGNLKDVMKESISAAASYVRSRAIDFGVEPPLFDKRDIHVHVPEGATPKDGPSAGIAMATAIVSVFTGIPVRRDIAMTGEVTLRGRVLPIGGLKEKLLAALRGGMKKVLIPEENAKDLAEIPASVKNGLEIVPVARMDQVIEHSLVRAARADRLGTKPIEPVNKPAAAPQSGPDDRGGGDRALRRLPGGPDSALRPSGVCRRAFSCRFRQIFSIFVGSQALQFVGKAPIRACAPRKFGSSTGAPSPPPSSRSRFAAQRPSRRGGQYR